MKKHFQTPTRINPCYFRGLALYSVCATILLLWDIAGKEKRSLLEVGGLPQNKANPHGYTGIKSISRPAANPNAGKAPEQAPIIHWKQVETEDFAAYIQNLRKIGCPEKTIRRIVTAEIHDQFDERRTELLAGDPIEFWSGGYGINEENSAAFQALAEEESQEIAALLGQPNDDLRPIANGRPAGLRFGAMLAPKKGAILDITAKARSAMDTILAGADGRELTALEAERWSRAEQERETALNRLLTPAEREEFDLRNSAAADAVRDSLSRNGLEVSEADFRKLFQIRKHHEAELSQIETGTGEAAVAEHNYRTAVAEVLGEDAVLTY